MWRGGGAEGLLGKVVAEFTEGFAVALADGFVGEIESAADGGVAAVVVINGAEELAVGEREDLEGFEEAVVGVGFGGFAVGWGGEGFGEGDGVGEDHLELGVGSAVLKGGSHG